ncbi:MAG: polysaccharide deacetylase family protein [Melioribacteraceae bacterium]
MPNIFNYFDKIKKGYKKNYREIKAFKDRVYPQFIFDENLITIKDDIPVFTLHSVNSEKFENQLRYLNANGYKTINSSELYEYLIGNIPITERTIVLTFDDGWKNLYTVAFPLLKKYKFKAICFLVANLIIEDENKTQENFENTNDSQNLLFPDSKIMCNWNEIREMEQSGVIDFQSHSMNHYLISTSSRVENFLYPYYDSYAMNFDIPLYREKGSDNYTRNLLLGTPIYENNSRFSEFKRFFDDETSRIFCINFVMENGGINFFKKFNWKKILLKQFQDYVKKNGNIGFYESENDQRESIFNEMYNSKIVIEKKLNKKVEHFCYPWWVGSELAMEISKEVGYLTNFWGIIQNKRSNSKGSDPFKIVRILSDDLIYRLPGIERKSIVKILIDRYLFEIKTKV